MIAAAYITTANVWVFTLILVGLFLVFLSFWLASTALFPVFVDDCRRAYARPIRTTLLGLLVGGPVFAIGLTLVNALPHPALKLVGGLVTTVPVVLGLAGSAGLASRIGHGLPSPTDDTQPWRRVLRGGSVLWLTFLLPLIGWILLWPLVVLSGVGAALRTWSGRRRAARSTAAAAAVPAEPSPAAPAPADPPPVPAGLAGASSRLSHPPTA